MTDKPVWTLDDDKQLSQLEGRYAPSGINILSSEVSTLNTAVRAAENLAGKDAARRKFWQNHQQITPEDKEALCNLHRKACQSRRIESAAIATLDAAVAQGLISEDEYAKRVYGESDKVLAKVRRRALDLISLEDELSAHATFAATASDSEKKKAMEAFARSDAWAQALSRFKEAYDAADPERKGELKRDHPEMYASAIGR